MNLEWYRSWPSASDWAERKLDSVPHVVDNLPKLLMTNHDYRVVSDYQSWPNTSPGFCMLEWDIALDPWSRRAFAAEALIEPGQVLVAPYRFHDTWCMFQNNDGSGPTVNSITVKPGEETCDSFGLGCIYFPTKVLGQFLDYTNRSFTDSTFGKWYKENYGPARMTWRVHPQHLHAYDM